MTELSLFMDNELKTHALFAYNKITIVLNKRWAVIYKEMERGDSSDRIIAVRNTSASHNPTTRGSHTSASTQRRLVKLSKSSSNKIGEFMNFKPAVIAQQIAMRDSKLYCAIQPWEFVSPACWKEENVKNSSGIFSLVNHFNRVGLLLGLHILSYGKTDMRAKAMGRWVRVGCCCLDINNYNGAILCVGLQLYICVVFSSQ